MFHLNDTQILYINSIHLLSVNSTVWWMWIDGIPRRKSNPDRGIKGIGLLIWFPLSNCIVETGIAIRCTFTGTNISVIFKNLYLSCCNLRVAGGRGWEVIVAGWSRYTVKKMHFRHKNKLFKVVWVHLYCTGRWMLCSTHTNTLGNTTD